MMQSGRTALASSGRISGVGLASARMIGCARHRLDHVRRQHAAGRQAEEDVGAVDDVGQRARVGVARVALLVADPCLGAAGVDHAVAVDDPGCSRGFTPSADEHVEAGDAGRAGAGRDELDLADVLADHVRAR